MCNYDVCKYNHGNGGLYLGLRRKFNPIQEISTLKTIIFFNKDQFIYR